MKENLRLPSIIFGFRQMKFRSSIFWKFLLYFFLITKLITIYMSCLFHNGLINNPCIVDEGRDFARFAVKQR